MSYDDDPELAELRRQRAEQMKQEQQSSAVREAELQQIEAQRQSILKSILTDEARERLNTIKIADRQKAESIENQLIQLASRGLKDKITDEQLKQILKQLTTRKREGSIRFKRR